MDNQLLRKAASDYKTPLYVFDLDAFSSRIRRVKEILGPQAEVYYAMKANPFLTASAAGAADGLEVCSPGEYNICRRAGVPASKIVLSGVNKEADQLMAVIGERGADAYTAESPGQLALLETCAAECSISLRVLLRLTSGNQFGMDEETILSVLGEQNAYPHLEIGGLQYYSGTQKKGMDRIRRELALLDRFLATVRDKMKFEFDRLEYGPGFQIPYFAGQEEPDEEALMRDFTKALGAMAYKGKIILEAGRFLAAPCGSYVTRVIDVKHSRGQGYCIMDGGINHVNYYGQAMAMKIPAYRYLPGDGDTAGTAPEYHGTAAAGAAPEHHRVAAAGTAPEHDDTRYTVCGSLCTSGDMLVKNLPLPGLKAGDMLVFDRIGAYSVTEGIYLFLSRELPAILTYTESEGLRLVRDALPTDTINDGSCRSC